MRQTIRSLLFAFLTSSVAFSVHGAETDLGQLAQAAKKKIAVIAVSDPEEVLVNSRGGGPGLVPLMFGKTSSNALNKKHSDEFMVVLHKNDVHPGAEMTAALVEQLTRAGYSVDLIKDGIREVDDPDTIDLRKINSDAEYVLIANFDKLGLLSGFRTIKYYPQVNLDFEIRRKRDTEKVYSQSIDFGADGVKVNDEEIPADPKYAYANFDEVMARQTEVIESFRVGYQQIAAQFARIMLKRGF